MYKLIPYKHREFKGHFIAYAIGIEYQTIVTFDDIPSFMPSTPLVKLYVNEEERISLLPLPYYRPILLTTPIYINGDERIREETDNLVIGVGISYDSNTKVLEVKKLIGVTPRIVLYGYWIDKVREEDVRKGYFKTVVIPSPASLYEFNITDASLEENIIKRYQFGYNAYLDSIFVYPRFYQYRTVSIKALFHNITSLTTTDITNHTLVSSEVVRIDKLMRGGDVELLFVNQFDYDNSLSYTYDNYLKLLKVDKRFKPEDFLLIGVKMNARFKQNVNILTLTNSETDIRGDFVLFYSNNEIYPFAMNYELG